MTPARKHLRLVQSEQELESPGVDKPSAPYAVAVANQGVPSASHASVTVFERDPAWRQWELPPACAAVEEFPRPRASVGNLLLQLAGAAFILLITVEAVVLMGARP